MKQNTKLVCVFVLNKMQSMFSNILNGNQGCFLFFVYCKRRLIDYLETSSSKEKRIYQCFQYKMFVCFKVVKKATKLIVLDYLCVCAQVKRLFALFVVF